MRALAILGLTIATGCMTDPNGDSCPWTPGSDGFCPSDSGGSSPPKPPSYHSFSEPRFIKLPGELRLVVRSSGEDYDVFEELAAEGALPPRTGLSITPGYKYALACSVVCVAAWRDANGRVRSAVRDATGWSQPQLFEGAIRAPAVATVGDLVLVAWSTWETDLGARVEIRRLDHAGNVIGGQVLATGVSHGHLSLAASPVGALITWEDTAPSTLENGVWITHAWVVAQPLARDGTPVGEPLQHDVDSGDGDYYRAAPAAFVDGSYRVVHGSLADAATWLEIDPDTATISAATIGELPWPRAIQSIVPLADGALLALSGRDQGSIIRVADDRIVADVAIGNLAAPAIAPTPEGVRAAYTLDGSLYVEDRDHNLEALTYGTVLAERYELEGCSTGGGHGFAAIALLLALCLRKRRR